MNKEKQIEEMRKEVASIHRFFLEDDDYESLDDYIADMLFEKGYRKQSEGYWTLKRPNCSYYCSCCGKGIKIKYGERAAILWDYCPNCGAKMKGDNNEHTD